MELGFAKTQYNKDFTNLRAVASPRTAPTILQAPVHACAPGTARPNGLFVETHAALDSNFKGFGANL